MPLDAPFIYDILRPTLNLDFVKNQYLDPRISYTAANSGIATYRDNQGLLKTAPSNNFSRFDYNGTGVCNGFSIEQASTNLLTYSRDLTNAAWVKGATATVALDQVGLDGSANSASSLTAGAVAATNTVLQTPGLGSAQRTYSPWIKRITGTGAISITVDGSTFTDVTSSVPADGAWHRVSLTATAVPVPGIKLSTSGDKIAVDVNQLEALPFYTSPIITAASTVTRNADVPTIATSAFGFNPNAGTLLVNFMIPSTGAVRTAATISDGTFNNVIILQAMDPNHPTLSVNVGGVSQVVFNAFPALSVNTLYKWSAAYQLNNYASLINNGTLFTDTSATVPVVTKINFGSNHVGGDSLNGYLQQVKYWPQRLSDSQLQQLTV